MTDSFDFHEALDAVNSIQFFNYTAKGDEFDSDNRRTFKGRNYGVKFEGENLMEIVIRRRRRGVINV